MIDFTDITLKAGAAGLHLPPLVLDSFLIIIVILAALQIIMLIINGVLLFNMAQTLRRTEDFHLGFVGHTKAQLDATFFQKRIFKLFRKLIKK